MKPEFELCPSSLDADQEVFRHLASGNLYRIIKLLPGKGRTGGWEAYVEYCRLRGVEGESYVRPRSQFLERFEPVTLPDAEDRPDDLMYDL